jgi:hypothetical protein
MFYAQIIPKSDQWNSLPADFSVFLACFCHSLDSELIDFHHYNKAPDKLTYLGS